ncbi:hypothetical protein [Faecalibacterium sp. OF04-11AC]|uniref:hypothetical protein n=1 Tax=Faecalibacterium sp. OF04-11AC TaxID=2293109 RepID=UPI001FA8C232|nr:hypothetical protein [Faecalibacterium sp. OF04-11AC]
MFKNPSFLFDIICTVVWLLLAVRYARKGFLASVVQLAGSLLSLTGARAFSGWAAGQVFQNFFAGSFRDQIAASITAGGVVDLSGIAQRYAGFLPESFRLPLWRPASAPFPPCSATTPWCWPMSLSKRCWLRC